MKDLNSSGLNKVRTMIKEHRVHRNYKIYNEHVAQRKTPSPD